MSEATAEKRPVTRIPSDDCVVEGRHPHRGEWVEIAGKMSVAEMRQSWNASAISLRIESLRDDEKQLQAEILELQADDEMERAIRERKLDRAARDLRRCIDERVKLVDDSFGTMAKAVARRVVAWNWTDDRGRPLVPWNAEDEDGKPYSVLDGSTETVELVELDELTYLRDILSGDTPKNDNGADGRLPSTDSATDSPETPTTPSSTTAPKATKS